MASRIVLFPAPVDPVMAKSPALASSGDSKSMLKLPLSELMLLKLSFSIFMVLVVLRQQEGC